MSDLSSAIRFSPSSQPPFAGVLPGGADSTTTIATLSADTGGRLCVEAWPHYPVEVALSCLVMPVAGDRVRLMCDGERLFVLDVLTRRDATQPLLLSSQQLPLKISAATLELEGREELIFSGAHLHIVARSCRWVSDRVHQLIRHWQLHCRDAERQVEHSDTLVASHITRDARQSLRIDSKLAAINAKAVLKIDGGQIHVG